MLSPTKAAVRSRKLRLNLENARRRGDVPEMRRCLAAMTHLTHVQFRTPPAISRHARDGEATQPRVEPVSI